jgi:hypothetical protein
MNSQKCSAISVHYFCPFVSIVIALIPFTVIGKLFGVHPRAIRNHAKKYGVDLNHIRSPGHPWAFPRDEIDQIVGTILRCLQERRPLTLAAVRSIVTENSSVESRPILYDTFSTVISASRGSDRV